MLPMGTARDLVHKLHQEIARILRLADVRQKLEVNASEIVANTPEEFTAYLRAELARWKKVAKEANIHVE